jgi:DNA-binding ferritin-like protein
MYNDEEIRMSGSKFVIPLVIPEEVESGDGRMFRKDAIEIRELPLPLLWQIKTGSGHDGSVVVGRIDQMERTDKGIGNCYGTFDDGPYGREAERLVRNGFLRGVSADMDRFEADDNRKDSDKDVSDMAKKTDKIKKDKIVVNKARVMAVTIVSKPAFQECQIALANEGQEAYTQEETVLTDGVYADDADPMDAASLVACGMVAQQIPVVPPKMWFENPRLDKATPLTVSDDGHVYGHIASWETDHIGLPFGTKPPRSRANYGYFHTGVVRVDDGADIPVGQLTLAGGHADLTASAAEAVKHYDDTASAVADVHAGEDRYGIWVAGALRPGVQPEQVRALRASSPSGDWRPIRGSLELVAVCQVNVPGFPIARARVASGQVMALVAAGAATLARMKSNPIDDLQSRLKLLEEKEQKALVAAADKARSDFANKKMKSYAPNIDGRLAEMLQQTLADVSVFAAKVQGHHWNVEGMNFPQLHELFATIYEDVEDSIDPLAENIRKMGYKAPFELATFAKMSQFGESDLGPNATCQEMIADLHEVNESVIGLLKAVFDVAEQSNEQGVADFIAGRIDSHQTWAWQLRVSLANREKEEYKAERAEKVEDRYEMEEDNYDMFFASLTKQGVLEAGLTASAGDLVQRARELSAITEFAKFTSKERESLADKGHALPDGSYPIRNESDLKNAIQAFGRSKKSDRAKVRKHITKRARALGKAKMIPENWKTAASDSITASLESMRNRTAILASADGDAVIEAVRQIRAGNIPDLTEVDPKQLELLLPGVNVQDILDAKEGKNDGRVKYTPKTQPRDAQGRFRQVLARLKQDLGDSGNSDVLSKIEQIENLDNAGDYLASVMASKDLLDIVDRLDAGALNADSLENVRSSTTELGRAIANLPLPFDNQAQKVRYSDLPPTLKNLMDDMVTRVESKIGKEDADIATRELKGFQAGSDVYSQADISSQMNRLLRLLT